MVEKRARLAGTAMSNHSGVKLSDFRKRLGVMNKTLLVSALIAVTLALSAGTAQAAGSPVFINEIHYDNSGSDAGEAIEIAGPAGTNLTGWTVVLYNGSNGTSYNTIDLSGTIPDQGGGFGALSFLQAGIQNGSPDGLALVDDAGAVIEFLSYEGSLTGTDGPAAGQTSFDIGVAEASTAPVGSSLQLTGTGTMGGDFTWSASQPNTFGAANTGQTFNGGGGPADPVINEFVSNHTGADSGAFVEVFGTPSTDYSAFSLLEIEGELPNLGTIDAVLPVGTTNSVGYWTDPEDMENATLTILLVEDFTGSVGDDIDTANDGVVDTTPWTRIVDDVATTDGGVGDATYSSTVLDAFFDGNPFGPGAASRIPNGTDTDTAADWVRNDFDGFGLPGFAGSPAIGEAQNTPEAVNSVIAIFTDPVGVCSDPATLIHDIQGFGAASVDVGNVREIEGVVVGDFQGGGALNGFFVQEEDADSDGDPATSEGIFVFDSANAVALDAGDVVRVRGTVTEFNELTEITNVETVIDCNATGTATSASLMLPVGSLDDFEAVEGMAVDFSQTLFASGNFTQARFGEVDLSVGGALDNPTNVVAPGGPANALQDANNLARIQLDDGSTAQSPTPTPYLGVDGTLRSGDSVNGLSAVMSFSFGNYELHPTAPVTFTRNNDRPDVPDVGGTIQVAAYNVLNFFSTIDDSGPICGPAANQGCRGADTASELVRQRDKLVTAINKLDAEVVGLMEIENHAASAAEADLIGGLNAAAGAGIWDSVDTDSIGDDAIKVAIIYQPAEVTPVGPFAILDSSVDPRFDDTRNRPMLVQTFMENATGETFTVAVNHLKSKGSDCDGLGDPDTGDGQGNCNITRTNAAVAIVDFLATDPTGSGDDDFVIMGDLNAYAQEDPVVAIEAGGYTDLVEMLIGTGFSNGAYSFNFFSQSGYLDHGLATPSLVEQVTGVGIWHVNSDEPSGLDYNNFNPAALYHPDEFRSSDHDPVIIGLELSASPMALKLDTIDQLNALLPTGDKKDDKRIAKAITRIERSLNPTWWVDEETLEDKKGKKVFDRERQAVKELEKVNDTDVQSQIDQIVQADRLLATIELDAAIAAVGNPSRIAKALDHLVDAEEHVVEGKFSKAINDFRKAWQDAEKAT